MPFVILWYILGHFGIFRLHHIALQSATLNDSMKIFNAIAATLMATAGVAADAEHTSRRLILGGSAVEKGTKTYTVGLREFADSDSHCGGVLITSTIVLTTSLCVNVKPPNYVAIGTQHLNGTMDGEQIPAVAYYCHPDRNFTTGRNDFSVIKLSKPSTFDPVRLPNADDSDTQIGMMAKAMGWGWTTYPNGTFSDVLLAVELRVWSFEDCYAKLKVDNTTLCAGGVEGKDACSGDNGGPLVKEQKDGDILIGLIGWGRGCGVEGMPTVFPRVSSAIPWIESMIASL